MKFDKLIYVLIFLSVMFGHNLTVAYANSVSAVQANIHDLLVNIAIENNLNAVIADDVQGEVSVQLTQKSASEMMKIIAQENGYLYEERAGTIYIERGDKPINLYNMPLHYLDFTKAQQIVNLVVNPQQLNDKIINNVVVDEQENSISFYATPEQYAKIKNFLAMQDKPPKQVALEAKVTAIQKDAAKDLGVSWEWSKLPQSPQHETSYDTVEHTIYKDDGTKEEVIDYLPVDEVTRKWKDDENIPGIIRFGRNADGYPYEFYYAAKIDALVSDGKASILARPNITTIQGQEAVINIGSEVPVPTVSTTNSTTTTSIKYREAGIILKCTPRVNEDGIITVKVHTEVSSPLYVEDMKAYRFQKRSADTLVRLKDGETMVIGGLIGSDEARQMSKIPFLGDIPILGNLFKHLQKSKSDTEVMIFLTAHEVTE